MLDRLLAQLDRTRLIPAGAQVLVGYSGGADSTCLLHLLHTSGVRVVAAHLHHGQRAEGDVEMERCREFAEGLGLPFAAGRADVPGMTRELKIGIEEAGRKARYAFLRNAAFRLGCDLIATGHTLDDRIETVLLNMTRGCGLAGLSGIPARRENIVRPLLGFTRKETREYCHDHGLWYHDDPTNADLSFSRARVRHRVIRELRTINPAFDDAVERMIGIVSEEDGFLNALATNALEQCEMPLNGQLRFVSLNCEVAFDRTKISEVPEVLFRRGIRLAVEALGGNLDFVQTETIASGFAAAEKGSVTSEEGRVAVEWNRAMLHVRLPEPESSFRHSLTVPGETFSDEFGWVLSAVESPSIQKPSRRTDLEVEVDLGKVKGDLYFRSLRPGDEMSPVGFSGHRKIASLFSDAKLTRAVRMRLPIICDMLGPIWAPGVCLSSRVSADGDSKRVLQLRFGPIDRVEGHNDGNTV